MKTNRLCLLVFFLSLPCGLLPTSVAHAATPGAAETLATPAIVFARMAQVHGELEVIRKSMGKPSNNRPELVVDQAAPREDYYEALVLLQNANRFCFDHTRERATLPATPEHSISSSDVLSLVDKTLERLQRVKEKYGIEAANCTTAIAGEKTPTDVFQSIVQANRQLNLLLDSSVSSSEVFEQVTIAVAYAARLMEQTSTGQTMPETPAFEANKMPADNFAQLLASLDRIHKIAKRSGLQVLNINANQFQSREIEPSDVLRLASLVVSELAYLHAQLPEAKAPREVFYAGRKFPSHVYQRVAILNQQLDNIANYADAHPDWLSNGEVSR